MLHLIHNTNVIQNQNVIRKDNMATETIHLNLTMNQHGQITLPKSLRKLMGLEKGSGLKLVASPTKATIERAETIEEVLADLDTKKSPKVRAKIKQLSNKTVADLRDEYIKSAAGQKHYKEAYDLA